MTDLQGNQAFYSYIMPGEVPSEVIFDHRQIAEFGMEVGVDFYPDLMDGMFDVVNHLGSGYLSQAFSINTGVSLGRKLSDPVIAGMINIDKTLIDMMFGTMNNRMVNNVGEVDTLRLEEPDRAWLVLDLLENGKSIVDSLSGLADVVTSRPGGLSFSIPKEQLQSVLDKLKGINQET